MNTILMMNISCILDSISGGSRGVQQVQMHPLQKFQKNKFLAIFEGFFCPLECFSVCHTTENVLVTCTRWA